MSIATYSFLPYLRQGIANNLQSSGGARGSFVVKLDVHGDGTSAPVDDKHIEIYGPGDIVGIDARAVVKTDPHNWITNFEANYLAYIDFYDEDLPWRYTPVPPAGQRLNPWIALVVLADGEFEEGQASLDRPLPFFKLKSAATKDNFFPKNDQLWAWAHVHFNGDLTPTDDSILVNNPPDVNASLKKLQDFLNQNPDFAYSRLVCPRKLKPSVSYHAFVIPAYESGRQAGVGGDAAAIANAKLKIAWEGADLEFPYYYRWKFNTGTVGDFEYLVRLLKPKVADSRVGRRVMDMTNLGANLVWTEDPDNPLGGILRLGGALKVPKESLTDEEIARTEKFDKWATKKSPELHPFAIEVAGFLNLADDYSLSSSEAANTTAGNESGLLIDRNVDSDPLITPPIYGRWHAMVERVYKDRNGARIDNEYNWLNELNLDPRFRVPAHFGTRVVQQNQENYMQAAWEQIGEVLKANRQIRYGQFSIAAGSALYAKHFVQANAVNGSKIMLLTAPLHKRVMNDGATVFHNVRQSVVPNVIFSAPMRRIVRPRGRLATQLAKQLPAGESLRLESVVTKISMGKLLPAPPKIMPPALPAVDTVAAQLEPAGVPGFLKDWLRRFAWLPYVPLVLAALIAALLLVFGASLASLAAGVAVAGGLVYGWRVLTNWSKDVQAADSLKSDNQSPQSVDAIPRSPDFRLTSPEENISPTVGGATDSANAVRFKSSLKDMYRLLQLAKADIPKVPAPIRWETSVVAKAILEQIRPEKTVAAWTWQQIFLPPWIKDQLVDDGFVEAMGYPKINTAMYAALKKISDELFLPNVELIEHNSITLLETNQPFIESYMVGLNHEFARELLWREYPTDQRGSYFRQFWDVSSILKDPALAGKPEEEQREPYYDIPKLHEWRRKSKLGDHDNRQKPNEPPKEEVVLVIRGELLKKYPTAVVYAHKADWTVNSETHLLDVHEPRSLFQQEEGDKEKPDPAVIQTPLYSAKVDPDIYFFGFDLTVAQARGESEPETPTRDNAGWFFVIKERPGEPRFGLDIPVADGDGNSLVSWNDLDWSKVVPGEEGVIDVVTLPGPVRLPAAPPASDGDPEQEGQLKQYKDDIHVTWDNGIDAANLAYVLYQVPMMVCVHAAEMLLKKKT
jgi:hypothetical protein